MQKHNTTPATYSSAQIQARREFIAKQPKPIQLQLWPRISDRGFWIFSKFVGTIPVVSSTISN